MYEFLFEGFLSELTADANINSQYLKLKLPFIVLNRHQNPSLPCHVYGRVRIRRRKTKHNTIGVGHHYRQTNTNNLKKT